MTRASVHVVSCAMALIAVAAKLAHAQAPPRAPTVPLLVVEAPPTFDLERFRSALETYVANAQLVLVPRVTADAMAICAAAAAAARDAHSPIALWVRWTAGEMVIERVGEAGCDAIESSTVEIAADQPAFVYRVAALKVASLVRELPAPPPPPPPPPPPAPVAPAVAVQAPADRRVVAIELGASAVAGTDAAERLYFVAVGAWFGRA